MRQLLDVHVMAALKSLLGAEAEARVVDKCAEIFTSLLSLGGLDAAQRRVRTLRWTCGSADAPRSRCSH